MRGIPGALSQRLIEQGASWANMDDRCAPRVAAGILLNVAAHIDRLMYHVPADNLAGTLVRRCSRLLRLLRLWHRNRRQRTSANTKPPGATPISHCSRSE